MRLRRKQLKKLLPVLLAAGVQAQEPPNPGPAASTTEDAQTVERDSTWVDRRYDQISERTDRLAAWVDGFFSQSRSVEESASSLIRIRPQYEWSEDDSSDWKLRVTGRLYLPAASDRLSLVFIGENGDFDEDFDDPGLASDGSSTVGLEYRVSDREYSRVDLTLGLKAGPKGKIGTRYRYQKPFWDSNRFRFSEELFWIGGDGVGTLSRIDLDHSLDKNTLIRWANKAEYSQESNGVEWSSRLAWIKRINDKSAVRVFSYIQGETDPRYLKSRGVGTSYRRKWFRRWLFWELEPNYQWRKSEPGANRDGVFSIQARVELVLGQRELAD